MAEDSELEKTEPASQKRLDDARKEGDVPRSRELATCSVLIAAAVGFSVFGEGMATQLGSLLSSSLTFEREQAFDMNFLVSRAVSLLMDVLIAFAPLAGLLILVAIGAPLLIGGWNFTAKSFLPNFGKLNPLKGLSNMVSTNSLVELVKAIAKTGLVGYVAWTVVGMKRDAVMALALEPLNMGSAHVVELMLDCFMLIVGALVAIAAIDVPYQLWHHANKLKMTREELKQEAKESDGVNAARNFLKSAEVNFPTLGNGRSALH